MVGLNRVIDSPSGVRTIAAARSMPICGAAIPIPFPNAWTIEARSQAEMSSATTLRASSASVGRSNVRTVLARIGSPSWTTPTVRILSLAVATT